MFSHHSSRTAALLAAILTLASPCIGLAAEEREQLKVAVDHARVVKIDRAAETVIIGNPSIVDVTVHDSETLVLTGRSYGITNFVVLDRDGKSIVDEEVAVSSFERGSIRIFRQAQRTTYSCLPECEPTVTIGDGEEFFERSAEQFAARQSMALGGGK